MPSAHILEAGYLIFKPLIDPREQPDWLRSDSPDLLTFVVPILGPTSTLIVHRAASYFAAGDTWVQFELADLGQTFGLGHGTGPNHPLIRSIERIHRFGFGELDCNVPTLKVRTAIPPISRQMAQRIPGYLTDVCPYIVR